METIQASYTSIFCWWSSDTAWSKGLISTERVCNGGKVGLEDMLSKVSSLFLLSPEKINYWIRLYLSEMLLMKLSFLKIFMLCFFCCWGLCQNGFQWTGCSVSSSQAPVRHTVYKSVLENAIYTFFLNFFWYWIHCSEVVKCLVCHIPQVPWFWGTRNFSPMFLIPSGVSCKLCMSLPLICSSFGKVWTNGWFWKNWVRLAHPFSLFFFFGSESVQSVLSIALCSSESCVVKEGPCFHGAMGRDWQRELT